jgi:hypothetical protein
MKRIIVYLIIFILFVVSALIFDWGRGSDSVRLSNNNLAIVVDYPKDGQKISSPLKVEGKAKGTWFFEGSFPVELVDINKNIIASGIATSTEDWMTEDFINFSLEIFFDKPTSTKNAILILKKDNPSGNPEFDQSVFIPVILK